MCSTHDWNMTHLLLRRFYFLDREKSVGDPDTTFLTVSTTSFLPSLTPLVPAPLLVHPHPTPSPSLPSQVPNIPMLTGFHKIRNEGFSKGVQANVIQKTGLGEGTSCSPLNRSDWVIVTGKLDVLTSLFQKYNTNCSP